jgi:hypothetical protein
MFQVTGWMLVAMVRALLLAGEIRVLDVSFSPRLTELFALCVLFRCKRLLHMPIARILKLVDMI